MPLYGLVRQEYIPTDVDEAEFDVQVTAPEGDEPRRHGRGHARGREGDRGDPGVRLVLTTAGGGFLGSVNQGTAYVRIAPHEERTFSLARVWRGLVPADPLAGLPGQLHASAT